MKPSDFILYYWCYDNAKVDLEFADTLAKHAHVILVGPWSYCMPDALKHTKNIHIMTYGEFEKTCLELIKNNHYTEVKGIYWRNHISDEIVKNPPMPLLDQKELDNIPYVTSIYREFLDITKYRQTSLRYPFVDLFTARGCSHRCSYCVWVRAMQGGPSYRMRSIGNVIRELKYIKDYLPQVKQIFFQDDTLPPKRATELSQAILNEKLKICWGGYSRAELDYETLKLMKESGCRTLHIGYESPIQKNLNLINKDITVEQMEEFASNVRKLGLWTSATFMLFPWMTKEEIKFTIDWAKKIKPKRMNFIQAQAYPNTPYAETLKNFNNLMTYAEMKRWEQWGFKRFYLYNPHFWCEVLKSPREWRNVWNDARGLLNFLRS